MLAECHLIDNTIKWTFSGGAGEGRVLKGNHGWFPKKTLLFYARLVSFDPNINSLCEFVMEKDTRAKQGRATK